MSKYPSLWWHIFFRNKFYREEKTLAVWWWSASHVSPGGVRQSEDIVMKIVDYQSNDLWWNGRGLGGVFHVIQL